jgi:two-component system chemotaxis sensor kinase CheA
VDKKDPAFLQKLLATFRVEAQEHLETISSGLLALEKSPAPDQQTATVETIFREAHSLKGAARAVNLTEIESLCRSLESGFAALKRQETTPSAKLFDAFHQTVDHLQTLLSSPAAAPTSAEKSQVATPVEPLAAVWPDALSAPQPEEPQRIESRQPAVAEKPLLTETVRISTAKLDAILLQVGEMLSAKLTAGQRAADLREVQVMLNLWKKEWAKVYPKARRGQPLPERKDEANQRDKNHLPAGKLAEFFAWNQAYLKSLESKLAMLVKSAEEDYRSLGGMVDNLLEDMKKVSMLPFSSLLQILPKAVRDLSRDQGKNVELVTHGGEMEIDRRILEEMKDPLLHLLRNCIDHGIEDPQERERKHKPARATVTLAIAPKDGKVEILIADDGAGIEVAKVRAMAAKLGLIAPEEAEKLSEPEVLLLLFQSGFSTSPIVTDISGRGLGLAIVREKAEKLGGTVSVETRAHVGTTFRIVLPLTLATFRGVLLRVDHHLFALPTTHVERVLRVNKAEIKTVENRETFQLNGLAVPLVRLEDTLELSAKSATGDAVNSMQVVVLGAADKPIAFVVDEVLNEQEVLVKSLGRQLSRVRNIAGATILGTGKVVPILNVADLLKSAVKSAAAPARVPVAAKEVASKRKSILIVEDSISTRMLLKNILESAGYQVQVAVDGVDALTALKTADFDLVVSDVEMPRMNGFDLTAEIRADKKLAELPVVLVTALAAREDRERGIDVGANAYIVKSSFEQSNLLEVIQRFL